MQIATWSADHRDPMLPENGVAAPEGGAPVPREGGAPVPPEGGNPAPDDNAPFPPADALPQHADDGQFPRALRNAGRILAAVTGVASGAAMLVIGGLYALLTSCAGYDGTSSACGDAGSLVESLELVAVLGGTAAAIAGGIGTAVTAKARWIAVGMSITIVLVMLLAVLIGMQEPVLN